MITTTLEPLVQAADNLQISLATDAPQARTGALAYRMARLENRRGGGDLQQIRLAKGTGVENRRQRSIRG